MNARKNIYATRPFEKDEKVIELKSEISIDEDLLIQNQKELEKLKNKIIKIESEIYLDVLPKELIFNPLPEKKRKFCIIL